MYARRLFLLNVYMNNQNKIRAAVVGYGNVGRYALQALSAAEDFEIAGVVRRQVSKEALELGNIPVVTEIKELGHVDVALLCTPTRLVEEFAIPLLSAGISTVDSFDIHKDIVGLRSRLQTVAQEHDTVAVVSSGWDPGSDSVVRMLMEAIVPKGLTYTDFGPGMSMGHTVAVKAIRGVRGALSMTIPLGTGIHRRMVYVELEKGYEAEQVIKAIKEDDYFRHDETHVTIVDDVDRLIDMGHGVHMIRKGVSGITHNQIVEFNMTINNPALTGQILVCAARAAMRQSPGAYTLPEIPVIDLLPGEREQWIRKFC